MIIKNIFLFLIFSCRFLHDFVKRIVIQHVS